MTIRLKSEKEIEILKEGGRRHAEILRLLAEMVEPGVSTLALEEEALALVKAGGDKPAHLGYTPAGAKRPFPAALCISINDEIVHGIPNETPKVLKQGDVVAIDLSVIHQGLFTDSAITVPVGAVDDEARELLKATKRALEAGIAAAKPGNHTGDIGFAISKVVSETRFSLAEDLVGHGLGYALHEEPYVPNVGRKGEGEKLVPGMVLAIEPMVNAGRGGIRQMKDGYTIKTRDGSRSAHFEHTVAITEKGNIVLTLDK
ncbi:MAG: type I methionyl aminopeptidase [Candidatus Zambryskibacteria bacterium RIFCSPLOWO2_02_FULL_51_21]|uniref:Methionine aminopeptidase n=1 Tax=Candidatus Zambryskibacteria bacterium RIFCSPHIGHO2_02_FULL_43_37 TaxID=1802749 RepID=A0A1G2TGL9_9BACT|nr:MAG: type I methionyl aminopeptidase [Candidatus Zambryskibacteria bacterium RIFCSPHIGHO2_01_FULL_52_18]OHA96430.1 MAG: type I methionyl aminopeptidase [Candidatus Zambryskibacteria bacterium RIFCSPHIGHO2_02_FULL_43_37]OHB11310.1 MAG: type I methionyl aminopeptidase [Candidatus Zambryskibacteria bacterium RIFCSPLOWO2_02_FULL_51_21]